VIKFEPREWDKTSREWYDGEQRQLLRMPHYCIASVADASKEIQQYIEAALPQYLDYVIRNSNQKVTKAMLRHARILSRNGQASVFSFERPD
jgi:hypothetical protein